MINTWAKGFLILYILTGLVPYFESIDKRYVQSLYLSIINIASIGFLLFYLKKKFTDQLTKELSKLPFLSFFLFVVWSVLSIIDTVNLGEYITQTNVYFQQLTAFLLFFYFLTKVERVDNFIKFLIIFLTSLELITSFVPYLSDIFILGEPIARSLLYRGFTGSVNIIAFTLLLKLPFFYYYAYSSKKYSYAYISFAILSIYAIFFIFQTRSAMLSVFLISLLCLIMLILNGLKSKEKSIYTSYLKSIKSVVLPMLLSITIGSIINNNILNQNSVNERLSTLEVNDYSIDLRLRYFIDAIETIIEKPLFGVGNGNWEIYSIMKDAPDIIGYTVPYHVHNDYLEISAESGIIGGFLYFFMIFYILFLLLRSILNNFRLNKDFSYKATLALSITVFLLDSSFNFPASRPYQQISMFFILSLSMLDIKDLIKCYRFRYQHCILFLLISVLPFSLYASSRVYDSSIDQAILLRTYNSGRTDLDNNFLEELEVVYPSVTATTIPIKSMKGFFYLQKERYEESIDLFNAGTSLNPYLYYSEAWKSQAYYKLEKYDSAKYYAKLAYNKIPNNLLHYAHYAQSLMRLKDSVALKSLYDNHRIKTTEHEEFYIAAMAAIIDKDETGFIENLASIGESELTKKAYYTLNIGYETTMQAATAHALGEEYYNQGEMQKAIESFREATELNPIELPYKENYANALMQNNNNLEALNILNDLINNDKTTSPKAYYMRGLILYELGEISRACSDLNLVNASGYLGNTMVYENLCLNN